CSPFECVAFFFFFQAEDGIRDFHVTGVQTCALPISEGRTGAARRLQAGARTPPHHGRRGGARRRRDGILRRSRDERSFRAWRAQIGRASCRERGEVSGGGGGVEAKQHKGGERVRLSR